MTKKTNVPSVSYRDPYAQASAGPSTGEKTNVHLVEEGAPLMDVGPLPGTEVNTYQQKVTTTTRLVEDTHSKYASRKKAASASNYGAGNYNVAPGGYAAPTIAPGGYVNPNYNVGPGAYSSTSYNPTPAYSSTSSYPSGVGNITGLGPQVSSIPRTTTSVQQVPYGTTNVAAMDTTSRNKITPNSGFTRQAYANPNANDVFIIHEHRPDGNPLVEAIATVAKGDAPHNLQTAQIIDRAIESLEMERRNGPLLNQKGQQIAKDTEELLAATKALLYEKNADEKFQQLIRDARLASGGVNTSGVLGSTAPLKGQANEALFLGRNVAREMINSKDFRLLLLDTIDTLRTIFAGNMEGKGDQLSDLVRNKLVSGEGLGGIGTGVKNIFLGKNKGVQQPTQQQQAPTQYVEQPVIMTSQIKVISEDPNTQIEIVDTPLQGGMGGLQSGMGGFQQQQQMQQPATIGSGFSSSRDLGGLNTGGSVYNAVPTPYVSGMTGLSQQPITPGTTGITTIPAVVGYVPEVATTNQSTTGGGLANLTNAQTRELALKLRSLLVRYAARDDFRRAAKSMFKLGKYAARNSQQITSSSGVSGNQNLNLVWLDLKDIIERFTGGKSISPLVNHFQKLSFMAREDHASTQYMKDFRHYVYSTWNNPAMLEDDTKVDELIALINRGRTLYNSPQYKKYTDGIMYESRDIVERIRRDPSRKAWANSFRKVAQDIVYDMRGNPSPSAMQDSISQMRLLLVPILLKELENVNLPRIEGYTPKYDYAFSNVVFHGSDILPDYIRLGFESDVGLAFRNLTADSHQHRLVLSIQNVRTNMDNIQFWFRKKTFPRLHDEGLLDVAMLGAGTSCLVEWFVEGGMGRPLTFYCNRASCVIDGLNVNIKQAHHSFLDRLVLKLFANNVRSRMETTIADKLLDFGQMMADQMNRVVQQRGIAGKGFSKAYASIGQPGIIATPTKDVQTITTTQTTLRNL